jgi:hypothetical protein
MNKSFLNLNNIISEFEWILDVLKSCQTIDQVSVTNNLYTNFMKKWDTHNEEFFELFEKNRVDFETEKLKMYTKLS